MRLNGKVRAVVTGLGVVAPNGTGIEPFWSANVEGRSGISRIDCFDPSGFESLVAGQVRDLDPFQYMQPQTAKRTDRFVHLGLAAAKMALEDSHLQLEKQNPSRMGVIVGSGLGGQAFHEEQIVHALQKGANRIHPMAVPRITPNAITGHIAMEFHLLGPNMAISVACASGTMAVGEALRKIQSGEGDCFVCGGAEAPLTPFTVASYAAMGALSRKRNATPAEASRPFDRDRDGFVIAEGAAMLILENAERAVARNAHIYGEVRGYAAGCGAYNMVMPRPDGRDAAAVMSAAIADAGLTPADIGYINAHGTSTLLNDKAEALAITEVFGSSAHCAPVSSTKSMIGHTIGAAGAIEALVSVLVLDRGVIPPTINYQFKDPECDLDFVPNEARHANVNAVLSNSFGFGSCNTSLVFAKWRE